MYIKRLNRDFVLLGNGLIAHKGIYGYYKATKKDIAQNSFESCKIAVDNKISFECDIRNTKDDIPVLAHDNVISLDSSKKKIKVSKYKYSELKELLKDRCPSKLEDILKYNNGRVGVIIDAKEAHIFYSRYRDNLSRLLNEYAAKGEIMLQSFNPFFMLSLRKHIKNVVTGQLICRAKTILDSFRTPKTVAYLYERIISLICFISRTDVINMENHSDIIWQKRTRIFISKNTNKKVVSKADRLLRKIDTTLYKGIKKFNKFVDKVQLRIIKVAKELTQKPVFAFTIEKEKDFNKMENLFIVNYIVDFSKYGVEEYIKRVKKR